MRKKNKLYTANKWNQPLFATDVDREHLNIFDGMTSSYLNRPSSWWEQQWVQQEADLANSAWGQNQDFLSNYRANTLTGNNGPTVQYSSLPNLADTFNKSSYQAAVQKGEEGIKNLNNKGLDSNKSSALKALAGGAAQALGTKMGNYQNGVFDAADPVYYMANGRESEIGNSLNDAGVNVFKSSAAQGNPWGMLAGAALKVGGGLYNSAFGIKTDTQRLNNIKTGISQLQSYKSDATDFGDVRGPSSIVDNTAGVYKGGWFSSGKANRKNTNLTNQVAESKALANRSLTNNVSNISKTQMDNLNANFAAFGGPLGDYNSGAIDYGFMSDYLTSKNRAASIKDKVPTNVFGSLQSTPMFALGGVMQTNGADFSDGLTMINAGGSHESNPYEGVQMGISTKNGQPNLLEEGETVFDDYVFAKRIKPDAKTKKMFHLSKNADTTFADLSKKIEKESMERPNDPISLASLKKQLHKLAGEQERQKQEQQAKEMQEAFARLSPEQQQEIMQQLAMEEQQAQQNQLAQAQAEQAAMQEQQAQGQNLTAEQQQALAQQQAAGQQGMEQPMMQEQPQAEEVQMAACGGKLNKFDVGGELKNRIYGALGFYTDSQFKNWAKKKGLSDNIDWSKAKDNAALWDAIGDKGAVLRDAMARGYDFGAYAPSISDIYDLDSFKDKLKAYTASLNPGWSEGHYVPDKDFPLGNFKTLKDLENSNAYKAYTKYIKDAITRNKGIKYRYKEGTEPAYENIEYTNPDRKISKEDYNILRTLYGHINGTSTNPDEEPVPLMTQKDNDGYYGLADNADELFEHYRTDGEGGIFHMTPDAKTRGQKTTNLVVNDDGTIEEIIGDVPKDLVANGTYSYKDPQNDNTLVYYKAPSAKKKGEGRDYDIVPVHKDTTARTLGLFGPAIGLGMQTAGIGAPDYSRLDTALGIMDETPVLAHYKTVPNYLTYKPMDIWYEQNRQNAISRATDRAIMNNASPLGTKVAGQLANGYNSQIASGDLFRKALEYNDAQKQKVEEFNRGTNQYNADAFTKTSATNAGIINDWRRAKSQLGIDVAKERLNTDASWYSNLYKNVDAMFKGLGDYGKENAQHNMIADMAADGIFGTISDEQNIGNGYVLRKVRRNRNSNAKGGKINRKKGLTF